MRQAKTKVTVKLLRVDNPDTDQWGRSYIGHVGTVEHITSGAYGGYVLWIRFPEELDRQVWGAVLLHGFYCFEDQVEVLSGNLHHAYYGEEA